MISVELLPSVNGRAASRMNFAIDVFSLDAGIEDRWANEIRHWLAKRWIPFTGPNPIRQLRIFKMQTLCKERSESAAMLECHIRTLRVFGVMHSVAQELAALQVASAMNCELRELPVSNISKNQTYPIKDPTP